MRKTVMIFSILLLMFIALVFPSHQTVEAKGKVSAGSGIAGINLEGLNQEEATEVLEQQIEVWKNQAPLIAESDYETLYIPRDIFIFDIEATLDELNNLTKREWSNFFLKRKNVQIPLKVELAPEYSDLLNWSSDVDTEATVNKAVLLAEKLLDGDIVIEYHETATFEKIELATVTMTLPEASRATIIRLAEELNEKVISSEEAFSFLDEIVLPTGMDNSETEMSFVASALYYLMLHTELEIIERHAADTIPTVTDPGLEAMIDREAERNLLIYNPTSTTYSVEAVVEGNELSMGIYTTTQLNQFTYVVENEKEIEPRTIYRYSNDLSGNEQEILTEGRAGLQLEIHREQLNSSEERELISRDFYPPQHEVILIAANHEQDMEEAITEGNIQADGVSRETVIEGPSLEERINKVASCDGDPYCESEENVSAVDKMIVGCFTSLSTSENIDDSNTAPLEKQEENRFCDLFYTTLIFYLLSNENMEEFFLNEESMEELEQMEEDISENEAESEEVE